MKAYNYCFNNTPIFAAGRAIAIPQETEVCTSSAVQCGCAANERHHSYRLAVKNVGALFQLQG